MSWFLGIVSILLLLDSWRLRQRLSMIPVIEPVDVPPAEQYRVFAGPGVHVGNDTVNQASHWAHSQSLDVIDLVPGDMGALEMFSFLQVFDPDNYRHQPFTTGRTSGHALLIKPEVLERAGLNDHRPADPVEFLRLAERLKRYACRSMDTAIAPSLTFQPIDPQQRKAVIRAVGGKLGNFILIAQPLTFGLLALAPLADAIWGTALLVTYHLQPLLALGRSSVSPKDLTVITCFRLPIETWRWFRMIIGKWQIDSTPDPVEIRRSSYDELLKDGLDRFFEPRRDTCPLCHSGQLNRQLTSQDRLQNKPGSFQLERCLDCDHIFQNPRLSIEGLDFYYRDFYDGLWEEAMDGIFGYSTKPYHNRAKLLEGRLEPKQWLDVGGGHGHFCCAAKDVWPNAQFDCLDLTDSVEEAVRRRWVTRGYRGLFPELASGLGNQYDVVSMSHYLEHVRCPEAEVAAAATVLRDGGYLMIEVPDPASRVGRVLGRFWVHWFQPQHQHFVSVENLDRLLARHGFKAVQWQRGETHRAVDLVSAVVILMEMVGPNPHRPWLPPATLLSHTRYRLAWVIGAPLAVVAMMGDRLMAPICRRPGLSNIYRVLAQKKV